MSAGIIHRYQHLMYPPACAIHADNEAGGKPVSLAGGRLEIAACPGSSRAGL